MGYGQWAMHPQEAILVLHRGYGFVDGNRHNVSFIANYADFALVHVEDMNSNEVPIDWGKAA